MAAPVQRGLTREQGLLERIAAGYEYAFWRLYRAHTGSVYTYLLRALGGDGEAAENLVQEVFLGAWRGAASFEGRASARAWLLGIAHHKAGSWLRARHDSVSLEALGDGGVSIGAPSDAALDTPESQAMEAWQASQVRHALNGLTPDHRAVVELVFYLGLTYAETAEVLGCPVGTVKSRLSWARHHLVRALRRVDGLD